MSKAFVLSLSNCPEGREEEFNRWYNEVWVPHVMQQVPELVACSRYEMVGSPQEGQGRFLAIYEVEADDPEAAVRAIWNTLPPSMFEGMNLIYYAGYQPITGRTTR